MILIYFILSVLSFVLIFSYRNFYLIYLTITNKISWKKSVGNEMLQAKIETKKYHLYEKANQYKAIYKKCVYTIDYTQTYKFIFRNGKILISSSFFTNLLLKYVEKNIKGFYVDKYVSDLLKIFDPNINIDDAVKVVMKQELRKIKIKNIK